MLRIDGVVARYGAIEALHGVSLAIDDGRVVTLLGGNGAGKTSTLRAIAGLLPIAEGKIEFNGTRLDGLPPHKIVRQGIALVSQARDLFPDMTVAENMELGALTLSKGEDKERLVEQQLTQFPRLRERYRRYAGTLSGGERAMLAIARALMSQPAILLLDEPTSGLAPIVVTELGKRLKALNERGQTILLVEQNVRMALHLAQDVYVIRNGRITLEADVKDVDQEELARSYLA